MMARKPHSKGPLWRHAAAGSLALLSSLVACGPRERQEQCPLDMPTPPFRLTVDTTEGALNPNLEIHIAYGGDQTETYYPGRASQSADICCATFGVGSTIPERIPCAEGDSDAAAGRALVVCDLWTGGAANLTIRDGAEVMAAQTLQATPRVDTPQQCGLFETLDAHWTYGLADAGVAVQD